MARLGALLNEVVMKPTSQKLKELPVRVASQRALKKIITEVVELESELAEHDAYYRKVVNGECAPDEKHCTCVPVLRKEIEVLREGHQDIITWGKAYPLTVFPEPDLKRVHKLLKAGGMTIDAVSASAMRHVLKGVVKIAQDALLAGVDDE